jgi:hypothetical protein
MPKNNFSDGFAFFDERTGRTRKRIPNESRFLERILAISENIIPLSNSKDDKFKRVFLS